MAQKVLITLLDDMTGQPGDDIETETFAVNGQAYEIDLSAKSRQAFLSALDEYVQNARKVVVKAAGRRGAGSVAAGMRESRAQAELGKIRQWAGRNGIKVAQRGRISPQVFKAYDEACGRDLVKPEPAPAPEPEPAKPVRRRAPAKKAAAAKAPPTPAFTD